MSDKMKLMTKAPITTILLHKNAQPLLEKALSSISWCKEIIILDDNSTDPPHKLASIYQAKLVKRELTSFAEQRNFALHIATQPWVLFLDADEVISDPLQNEIQQVIQHTKYAGFLIPRVDEFMSRVLRFGETNSLHFLRLAKKDAGQWSRAVHEQWNIQGSITLLHHPILHKPHESISTFLDKINHYTQLELVEHKKTSKIFILLQLVLYPFGKFVQNYILRLGILDGFPGLCMAYMMSIHSLVVRVKMYE